MAKAIDDDLPEIEEPEPLDPRTPQKGRHSTVKSTSMTSRRKIRPPRCRRSFRIGVLLDDPESLSGEDG